MESSSDTQGKCCQAFRLYIIWEKKKAILWAAAVMTIGYLGGKKD